MKDFIISEFGKIIIIAIVVITGLVSIYFLGDDNPIEELSEALILKETGLDIEFSPEHGDIK